VSGVVGRVFMSYRREDAAYPAGWLFDRLTSHFGKDQVFRDVNSIQLGDDFAEVISAAIASCDVLLALIGGRWLTITGQDGRRRLDDPSDFVRLEIEAALTREVRVIPILVEGGTMPSASELPPSMARLGRLQAFELSPYRFAADTQQLLGVLDQAISEAREQARQLSRRAAAQQQQIKDLQSQIRRRAAAQDWAAVLIVDDQLKALDPAAADPDGLAANALERISRQPEAAADVADPAPARTLADPAPSRTQAAPADARPRKPGAGTAILSFLWALLPLTAAILIPLLAAIPFLHAGARLHKKALWWFAALYGLGSLALFIVWFNGENNNSDIAVYSSYTALFALSLIATFHAFALRRRVFASASS
jgi:TIR domain